MLRKKVVEKNPATGRYEDGTIGDEEEFDIIDGLHRATALRHLIGEGKIQENFKVCAPRPASML